MRVTRSREYTINMGNNTYESVRLSASSETEFDDNVPGARDKAAELANELLDAALRAEVEYYSSLTLKRDSFIHTVHADLEEKKNA